MDSLALMSGREPEYVVIDIGRWFDAILRIWKFSLLHLPQESRKLCVKLKTNL